MFQAKFSALPLGIFVFLMVWIPPVKLAKLFRKNAKKGCETTPETNRRKFSRVYLRGLGFGFLGFTQMFVTLFVGSSAPLNLPFLLRQQLKRDQLVATSAMMMTGVSLAKIGIFIAAGFSFSAYLGLMVGLVFAVFAGSWGGTRVRQYIPEQKFARLLKIVLSLLALRLIAVSVV
jgi:uncharacterized membrane protein YfcA